MDKLRYELLVEIHGRMEAELVQSYLEANGIPVEMFQEAVGHNIYPVMLDGLGRVQIFVPIERAAEARALLEEYQKGVDPE